ncbi:putative ribokinase [Coemansia sp. RSA 1813]|nr:putative ribokinase [Coemansia sp. RSA 1646]KAJ1772230.1 putative ribokinase [Coemansia sp. RSA 1843]KAJ2091862.1 putative ribokinase [Coemansia sp. RSA 986]KAJ2215811.1 putative ribokinase [Coemansia sp. RSA 487]KAJ2571742.1 putative ribokinase [Coemansia sp. RSA 1813]
MDLRVFTFASINIDEVYSVPHIVRPGETISSTERQQNAGGKGANASVAAARAGAQVHIAGLIGKDGLWVRDLLSQTGANVEQVRVLDGVSTGRAIIQVDRSGENAIFLFPGTNHKLAKADAHRAFARCTKGDWLLLTNETTAVAEAIAHAHSLGMQVLWNPAPMNSRMMDAKELVDMVDVLVLNETELLELAKQIEGVDYESDSSQDHVGLARQIIVEVQIRAIIVTLGSKGSIGLVRRSRVNSHSILVSSEPASAASSSSASISSSGKGDDVVEIQLPCAPVPKEKIMDTTGAGDTWVGYFVAELARTQNESPESIGSLATLTPAMVRQAMRFATYASGLAVTEMGAIPAIPERSRVEAFLKTQNI